jgi:hypothetical protein
MNILLSAQIVSAAAVAQRHRPHLVFLCAGFDCLHFQSSIIMTVELNALIITAASIGFFHTILGPDHYLPFIMMSWARKWSVLKTSLITLLCGLGHITSSVVLGLIGVAMGLAVKGLEHVESVRGNLAAWPFSS